MLRGRIGAVLVRSATAAAIAIAGLAAAFAVAGTGAAADPVLNANVGPGSTISLTANGSAVTSLPAGTYTVSVNDQSSDHNFHLSGPGVNQATGVESVGQTSWTVTLSPGTYQFVCDPHASFMRGSFTVTGGTTSSETTTTATTTTGTTTTGTTATTGTTGTTGTTTATSATTATTATTTASVATTTAPTPTTDTTTAGTTTASHAAPAAHAALRIARVQLAVQRVGARKRVVVRVHVNRAALLRASLVRAGKTVVSARRSVRAGTAVVRLPVGTPGTYRLALRATAGGTTRAVFRSVRVRA